MKNHHEGHFSAKHPAGTVIPPKLKQVLSPRLVKGSISCLSAHEIAQTQSIEPIMVGQAMDLLEGRIDRCQLGLFGYADRWKIAAAGHPVSAELHAQISKTAVDGRMTCAQAWHIAASFHIPRLTMGNACETLNIKIVDCQLGAF